MTRMKALGNLFQKITPQHLRITFLMLVICKLFFLIFVLDGTIQVYKTETDADYYHWFAIGISPDAYSIWSYLLKDLNDFKLYNRTVLTIIIYVVTTLLTPFIYASLLTDIEHFENFEKYQKIYWFIVIYVLLYPTLNLFSLDIFRDAVMVFLVGVSFYVIKIHEKSDKLLKLIMLIPVGALMYMVYLFRPYLGGALLVAFLLHRLNIYKINKIFLIVLYFIFILFAREAGWLTSLLVYRSGFGDAGGSTFNLPLLDATTPIFVLNYILSFIYQFFGVYINSMQAAALFFCESIFVILAVGYIFIHRKLIKKSEEYLILFATVYAAIWTFINDNMGTAIRLRMFDYITIVVVAASLYIRQLNAQKLTKLEL